MAMSQHVTAALFVMVVLTVTYIDAQRNAFGGSVAGTGGLSGISLNRPGQGDSSDDQGSNSNRRVFGGPSGFSGSMEELLKKIRGGSSNSGSGGLFGFGGGQLGGGRQNGRDVTGNSGDAGTNSGAEQSSGNTNSGTGSAGVPTGTRWGRK